MARFLIDLSRAVTEYAAVYVEAGSEEEAIEIALNMAEEGEVDWDAEFADIVFDHIIGLDDEDETDEE
jgi:hypothetical protein